MKSIYLEHKHRGTKHIFANLIVLIIMLFGLSQFVIAQDNANADAVYLKQVREYQVNEDGSLDFKYQHKLQYLTYASFNRLYGETFIVYNPQFQKLKINNAVTTMANGKKVVSPQNAFNEVLPRFASEVPAHNHLREMVVTHTGLERNCVVDLEYTLTSHKDYYPYLMGNDILAETSPIKELVYIIKVPKATVLHYTLFNLNVKPEKTETDKQIIYKWTFKNIPEYTDEAYQSNQKEYLPILSYSTAKDYRSVLNDFVSQSSFNMDLSADIKAIVDNLLKDETDELKKALKLQTYIVNQLRLYNVPMQYSGFKIRGINEVLKDNGGNELEKTILLNAMLNYAGISSEIIAAFAEEFINTESVNLMNGDLHYVKISLKDRNTIFLSAISEHEQNYKYFISGKTIIPLKKDNTNVSTARENALSNIASIKASLNITKDNKLNGNVKLDISKGLNPYFDIIKDTLKIGKLLNSYLDNIETNNIKTERRDHDKTILEYNVKEKELSLYTSNQFSMIELPQIKNGTANYGLKIMPNTRISPIELPLGFKEEYDFEFTLIDGRSFGNQEVRIQEENKIASVLIDIKQQGNKIKIKRQLKLSNNVITPEFYNEFRKIMNIWNNPAYRQLIIKETK